MKEKVIYAKQDSEINRFICIANDFNLKYISDECVHKGYDVLASLINLFLNATSKLHLSYAMNNLINYVPESEIDCELFSKVISNIYLIKQNKILDLNKFLFIYYQTNLFNQKHKFKDMDETNKNIDIPYIYSYK